MPTKYTPGLIITTLACVIGSSLYRGCTNTQLNPFEFQIRNYLKIFCYDTKHLSNNTTVAVINDDMVTALWSAYSSITYLGNIIGCFTVSIMADRFGPKNTLTIVTGLCGILSLIQNLAIYLNIYPLLLIGRIFNGYGSAFSSSLTALFLTDIAPQHLRWGFATADYVFLISGSVIPVILALPSVLGTSSLWMFIFIVGIALLFPILFLTCQPEGPQFLIQEMKSNEVIISSIRHYEGADADVCAILKGHAKLVVPISDQQVFRQFAMFRQKKWRNHVLITLALSCGHAYSGVVVVIAYSTSFIAEAGVSEITAKRCFIGITMIRILIAVLIALQIDNISSRRKALLCTLWATIGVLVGLIFISLVGDYGLPSASADVHTFIAVVKIFLIFIWFGLVTVADPLIVATNLQCYPQSHRAAGSALYLLIVYANLLGISFAFPIIQSKLSICSVVLFPPILLIATIYLHIKLPETNGTDGDDISNTISFGKWNQSTPDESTPLIESNE